MVLTPPTFGWEKVWGLTRLGWETGNDTANFWDIETTGASASGRVNGVGHTVGVNTSGMTTESTFTDAGWDFENIWGIDSGINDGYPYLLWVYTPHKIPRDFTRVLWFQPNNIISGTTLPDRATDDGAQNGVITWGSNPAGINITHSGLDLDDSYYDYMFEPIFPDNPDIITPEPGSMTSDIDTDKLAKNPLNPVFQAIDEATGGLLPLRLLWLGFAIGVLIASMVYVQHKTEHITFTSLTGLAVSVLFYVGGAFPLWVVVVLVIGLIASIIAERQPVL
jgi:hypothetical protein